MNLFKGDNGMQCPKCGFEQPDGTVECGKCGVIMAKALRSPARPASPSPPAAAPLPGSPIPSSETGPEKRPAPLVLIAFLLAAVIVMAWWLNYPRPGDVPDGAYVNMKHRFALSAPPDWLLITPGNFKQIMAEYKDRFPRDFQTIAANPGFEVSFVRMPATAEEFAPSLNVVVMPLKQNLPPLTESAQHEAAKVITTEMGKTPEDYTMESSSIVAVDGLASLQITGTASLAVVLEPSRPVMSEKGAFGLQHVAGHTQAVSKTFILKALQVVPGRKRGYVISFTAEASSFPDVAPVFQSVTRSFRVMERPPLFGPVMMGALNGGLLGAGLYLLYVFSGRVILALSSRS